MPRRKKSSTEDPPDLYLALDSLQMCRRPDGTFLVDQYLCACNQLFGFLSQLSKGLKITLRQIESGIKALEIRRVAGPRNVYETFQGVIEYELENKQASAKTPMMSGCRALLLVHDHFKFITRFLKALQITREASEKDDDKKQSNLTSIYQRTISSHHSAVMQAVSRMSLKTVPAKRHLLSKIDRNGNDAFDCLQELLKAAEPICDRIHKLCYDTDLEQLLTKG